MVGGFRMGRRRGLIVGAAAGTAVGRHSAKKKAQAQNGQSQQAQSQQAPENMSDKASDLEKLAELKNKGILTDEEFEAQKQKILNS